MIIDSRFLKRPSGRAGSQARSLLRDLADGLAQQMIFWGQDVKHPGGNLLVRAGMTRIARERVGQEGSSRYRQEWQGGVIEIHGFCAGWYPAEGEGVIFIRNRQRLLGVRGGMPTVPGAYEGLKAPSPDALLAGVRPLVQWWIAYEERVAAVTPPAYREACWQRARRLAKARAWLPPAEVVPWLRRFLDDPQRVDRTRRRAAVPFARLSLSPSV